MGAENRFIFHRASPKDERVALEREWEKFISGNYSQFNIRKETYDSWKRCLEQGVNPFQSKPPLKLSIDEVQDYVTSDPIFRLIEPILKKLKQVALDFGYLVAYCNSAGEMIYCDGDFPLLLKAEDINLSLGSKWNEGSAGTNGIGTALATNTPTQIFAGEHFCHEIQSWNCSSTPVRDPATGKTIGIVNLSCFWTSNHPKMLEAVISSAHDIEHMLYAQLKIDWCRLASHFSELSRNTTVPLAVLDRGGRVVKASPRLYEQGWIGEDQRMRKIFYDPEALPSKMNWEYEMWRFEVMPYYYGGLPIGSVLYALPPDVGCYSNLLDIGHPSTGPKSPQRNQFCKSLFEHHPDPIFAYDVHGTLMEANPAATRLLGYETGEWRASKLEKVIISRQEGQRLRAFANAKQGVHDEYEVFLRHKQGHLLDGIIKSFPIIVENEIVGVFEVIRDNTSNQQILEDLKSTKEQLDFFLQSTEETVVVVDTNLKVIKVNKSFETVYGWKEQEILGKELPIIPDYLKTESESVRKQLLHSRNVIACETIRKCKDGTLIDVSHFSSPLFNSKGIPVAFVFISRDITKLKRMNEAKIESEKRLRTLIEAIPDLVIFKDGEGRWIEANHHSLVCFQLERIDYRGKTDLELSAETAFYQEALLQCIISDRMAWEAGGPIRIQEIIPQPDGVDRICDVIKIPVYHEEGTRKGLVIIGRDITELKQTEELLRKSEKLAVVGQLAAGIAHEIRNPLTTLKGFLKIMECQLDAKGKEYLEIMQSEIEQLEWITSQFMTVAKPQAVKFQRHELRRLIEQVTTFLYPYATMHNVQFKLDPERALFFANCDDNQLKQVFINILKNAVEAMPSGGPIEIRMKKSKPNTLSIRISDRGCGIAKDRIPHLGEPFYSLKEKGVGLGLMICYKIMKEHLGTVTFESEEGQGTTVILEMPISDSKRVLC
ncbi:PAS domain S-box protein [Paenibacillus sp. J5C_2022]|uniref:PAS domain S-box protein n=1 Tax=Paenibacillus sp. J5C2022 TaxID=2977129 RepID=UPI0021D30CA8|nr:PAS domain S-box protein [Paenibacillus sp. J5C2022]MCU6712873.1 PAS domain S-box protein [Paenibacillus sp. J5C2022]